MKINSIYLKCFKIFGPEGINIDFSNDSELILVTGRNGDGKCLSKDTELEIEIEDKELRKEFLNFLENKE